MNEVALKLAVDFIKHWEGLCLRAYPDIASPLAKDLSARNLYAKYKRGEAEIPLDLRALSGHPWSLGYGETQGITEGMVWTPEQATERLQARVQGFMQAVLKASPKLSGEAPEVLAAVTSLCYNIGVSAYTKSTVARCIAVGDDEGAADAMLMWNRAGGVVVSGLVNRRKAEREMFLRGVSQASAHTQVVPKADTTIVAEKPVEEKPAKQETSGGIMSKLMALWALFHKGSELVHVEKWKSRQISSTMIGMFIIAAIQAAKVCGIDLPGIDSGTATTIGAGLLAVVNVVLTTLTSKRAGLPVASEPVGASVRESVEPEAAQDVQDEPKPDVAAAITAIAGGVEGWLQSAHANVGQRRTEDSSYFGT